MKLHELFEKDSSSKLASKDPKVLHAIKMARAKYHGRADDDLSALVSMMGDEQKVQDKELGSLDDYNMDQDVEINDTERVNNNQEDELDDLRAQIDSLRGPRAGEITKEDSTEHPGFKELTNDLVGYPNISLEQSQAITIPAGTKVDIAQGGDYHRQQLMKFDAIINGQTETYFASQKQYYNALADTANVQEEIVPYKTGHPASDLDWIDDETGELYTDKEHSEMNKPVKQMGGLDPEALSAFGDIAAGGGDPIDHLITTMGYRIDDINAEARSQGYTDAHEWASSYNAMEDLIRLTKTINK